MVGFVDLCKADALAYDRRQETGELTLSAGRDRVGRCGEGVEQSGHRDGQCAKPHARDVLHGAGIPPQADADPLSEIAIAQG